MSDDAQIFNELEPPIPGEGSPGTEAVWQNIDRQYDTEFLHHLRVSKLHQRNISFAAEVFQSQMLGLMLLGESEMPLVPGGNGPQAAGGPAEPPDPTTPS